MVAHVLQQEEVLLQLLDLIRMELFKQVLLEEALAVLSAPEDPVLLLYLQPALPVLKHHQLLLFLLFWRLFAFITLQPVEGGKSPKNRPFLFYKLLVVVIADVSNKRSPLLFLLGPASFLLLRLLLFGLGLVLADRLFLAINVILISNRTVLFNPLLLRLNLLHKAILKLLIPSLGHTDADKVFFVTIESFKVLVVSRRKVWIVELVEILFFSLKVFRFGVLRCHSHR